MSAMIVIARSAATKQSSWIATARFAHLAMTDLMEWVEVRRSIV